MAIIQLFSKFFSNVKSIQRTIQFTKDEHIQLKPKLYRESIHFSKNVVLVGDNDNETIIEGLLIIPKGVSVTMRNLTISPTAQMYIEGNVVLNNCRFVGSKPDVLITVDGGKLNANDSKFYNANEIAITLINNSKAIFDNCKFKQNGKAHILAESSQACIENSEFSEAKHALLIKNHSMVQTKNVHLHHHANTQVLVEDAKFYDYESMIERGEGKGIYVSHDGVVSIQGTVLRYNGLAQLSGQKSYITAKNCKIYHGRDVGVAIQNHCETQISYCEIFKNNNSNVEVTKQGRMNIEYCHIHSGESHGLYINQESIVNLIEVIIKEHRKSQILILNKSICSMKQCLVKKGYHVGICVEEESSCAIVECEIMNNSNTAITIFQSELTIVKSTISQNIGNGILAMSKATVEVDSCQFYDNEMPHIACKSNVQLFIGESELFNGKSLFIINDCELTAVDSTFHDSHNVQIEICDMSTARFDNCQIYNGESYGIKVLRNSSCYLIESQIFNHELSQVVVNDSSVIIKNSELFDGSKNAFHIQNHSEVFIQDCFISKHAQHQIWIDYESIVDLKSVQLTEGAQCDLFAQNQSSVYVADSIIRNNKSRFNVQAVNYSKIEIGKTVIENECGDIYYSENNSLIKQLDC